MDGDFGSERLVKADIEARRRLEGGIQDTAEKRQGWQHSLRKGINLKNKTKQTL